MPFSPVTIPAGFEKSSSKVITLSASSPAGMTSPISPTAASGRQVSGIRVVMNSSVTFLASQTTSPGSVGANVMGELTVQKGNVTLIQAGSASSGSGFINDLTRIYHIQTGQTLADVALSSGAATVTGTLDTGIVPVAIASDVPVVINLQSQPISMTGFSSGSVTITVYFSYLNQMTPGYDTHIVKIQSSSTYSASEDYAISQEFNVKFNLVEAWIFFPSSDSALNYLTFEVGSTAAEQKVDPTALTNIEQVTGTNVYTHIAGFFRAVMPAGVSFLPTGASSTQNQLIANVSSTQTASLVYYLVVMG